MNPLEKQILLSLAIIKALSNRNKSLDEQGARIQKLNSRRLHLLEQTKAIDATVNPADAARIALLQYVGKLAANKIRQTL